MTERNDVVRSRVLTAPSPGAIGIIELRGDVVSILRRMTGRAEWPISSVALADFDGVDTGVVVRLETEHAWIMPHAGPRVMQVLRSRIAELGAVEIEEGSDVLPSPEAGDGFESLMLSVLARAASPLAVDLLLDQPRRWRDAASAPFSEDDEARSLRLRRLIQPPLVVVTGPPNVGKSTLTNLLAGRAISIAADLAGTTRDYTVARVELNGLVVNWFDTPGIRTSHDPIEHRAIELAARLIDRADLLLALTDHEQPWPSLPRRPDLRVSNKTDLGSRAEADHSISARSGEGIAEFVSNVRSLLVSEEDLRHPGRWSFDDALFTIPGARSDHRR